jgi:hypothetical protein
MKTGDAAMVGGHPSTVSPSRSMAGWCTKERASSADARTRHALLWLTLRRGTALSLRTGSSPALFTAGRVCRC